MQCDARKGRAVYLALISAGLSLAASPEFIQVGIAGGRFVFLLMVQSKKDSGRISEQARGRNAAQLLPRVLLRSFLPVADESLSRVGMM